MKTRRPVVLIVEDESHISDLLRINLSMEGYETIVTDKGADAIRLIRERRVDLVLLDVMLPDGNGIDVCRKIRHIRKDTPILMLSALGQSSDKIKGLKSGADDYIAKPFNLEELLLRLDKLLDRYMSSNERIPGGEQLMVGNCTFHLDKFEVFDGDQNYSLTPKEAELIRYMYERRNQVLSRQKILEEVWGYDVYPNTRTIDNMISSFRKYVRDDSVSPTYFKTVRGVGYMLSM